MQKRQEEKELFGYTNEDNPFNDTNLTKPFVWKKMYEKKGIKGSITKHDIDQKRRELKVSLHLFFTLNSIITHSFLYRMKLRK